MLLWEMRRHSDSYLSVALSVCSPSPRLLLWLGSLLHPSSSGVCKWCALVRVLIFIIIFLSTVLGSQWGLSSWRLISYFGDFSYNASVITSFIPSFLSFWNFYKSDIDSPAWSSVLIYVSNPHFVFLPNHWVISLMLLVTLSSKISMIMFVCLSFARLLALSLPCLLRVHPRPPQPHTPLLVPGDPCRH